MSDEGVPRSIATGCAHQHIVMRISIDPPAGAYSSTRSKQRLDAFERELLVEALEQADGNRTEAARALGIGRATLHDKLNKYGI